MHLSHILLVQRVWCDITFFLNFAPQSRHNHSPAIYSCLHILSSTKEQHICITLKAWDQRYRKWNWHIAALSYYMGHAVNGCRFQYGGHYQISFVSWSSFSNLSLSLVMSPLLKKERAWAIYIYISHYTCCIFVMFDVLWTSSHVIKF